MKPPFDDAYSLTTECAKNYCNQTLHVVAENVDTKSHVFIRPY